MIYWKIIFADGSKGYQVMDDTLNNATVVNESGQPLTGELAYSCESGINEPPEWANA